MNDPLSPSLVGWVALCLVPRLGGRTMSALLEAFGSPRAVFDASEAALLGVPRIGRKTLSAIRHIDLGQVENQIRAWQAQGITLLTWQHDDYPAPLLTLPDRPPLLFAMGELRQDWRQAVAVVGTRQPSRTSAALAERVGRELAARGWLIVSGLARGIDAAAHHGALKGGHSAAVLGCGVDVVHPVSNRGLAQRLLKSGVLYAEAPPGAPPTPGALMARNRLIAGLSKAVIVIEAELACGSMETARHARRQQRPVLTVDRAEYEGNQALLRMEAQRLAPDFEDWDGLSSLLADLPEPPRQLSFFE